MQSYDEWKAKQFLTEQGRNVPYIPSSENKPVGNSKDGVPHRSHEPQWPVRDSTAPSSNSGGLVRKEYDWQTFINDKYTATQAEIPEIPEEMPRVSGLGDQGMASVSRNSFPEDPMDTQADEIGDPKGQFEHCTWNNYSKWRSRLDERQQGMRQLPQMQGMNPAVAQPRQDPRMNPAAPAAAGGGGMDPAAAGGGGMDPAAAGGGGMAPAAAGGGMDPAAAGGDPAEPQNPALDQMPSGIARVGKYFLKMLKGLSLQKQMLADKGVSIGIAQNLKGGKSAGGRLQRARRSAAAQAAQAKAPAAMSKDEIDRPTRPSGRNYMVAGPIKGGHFGPHKKGGPMTMKSMEKR